MNEASVPEWPRSNGEREPLPAAQFQIGPYRVDPSALLITDGINPQRVERKVMEVLLCLVGRQGQTVPRETLFEEAWENNFVSDSVLHRAISVLRAALGDNPREPKYIETIPRVGYRLLQPVQWQEPNLRPDVLQQRKSVARWRLVAVLAGVSALAIAVSTLAILRHQRSSLDQTTVRPVTATLGYELDPAVTADGQWLAYIHIVGVDAGHQGGLYVTSVEDTSQPRLLSALTENERHPQAPAWNPDGTQLAWIETSEIKPSPQGRCSIQVQPLAAEAPTQTYACNQSTSLDWSPDGTRLLTNAADSEGRLRIRELDLGSGEWSQWLTNPPADHEDTQARYDPEGKRIAVVRAEAAVRNFVVILDSSGRANVKHEPGLVIDGLDWWNDNELILSIDGAYGSQLWRWRLSDGRLDRLRETQGGHSPAGVGDRVLYVRDTFDSEISALNLEDESVDSKEPYSFIESTHWDRHPQVSPNGVKTAFVSDRSGVRQVWILRADGTESMVSRINADWVGLPRWSPDGRSILFESHSEDGFEVHLADVATDSVESVEVPFDFIREPAWAPDGRLMISAPVDGDWQLWIRDDAEQWKQFTDDGGLASAASPGGAWIYYTKYGRDGLWRRPLEGGEEEPVLRWLRFSDRRNWALSRDSIIAVRTQPEGRKLVRVTSSGEEVLVDLGDSLIYGVSATDSMICFGRRKRTGADLYLLQSAAS